MKNLSEAKIYVGTYKRYNNGSLAGAWLDLSDYSDKEEFLNACLVMRTLKDPFELLDMCAALESAAGRVRKERWGDRTLDADILLYGQEVIDEEGLIVPHVGICEREFVLAPLSEIAPGTIHPVCGATVAQLYAAYKEKNR